MSRSAAVTRWLWRISAGVSENTGAMMADQEHNYTRELSTTTLEQGLQAMLDLLTDYFGNNATRTEWLVEIQKRFTGRDGKLRRGWSDDSIDRKIHKLEQMGLITGGRGRGEYYSAVATAKQSESHHSGAGDVLGPASPAVARRLPATESFVDVLKAAKLQLLNRGKPPAA